MHEVATVEIVIPVHNEQGCLAASVYRLHAYLSKDFPLSWTITIADNASIDRTHEIALALERELDRVGVVRLDDKGRGRALRTAWSRSSSPVVAYMDVDLSTDLAALLPLVAPLVSGHSDLAIGTRLAATARVARGAKREAISRTYNLLLRTTLQTGFSDAQCGFKAARTDVVRQLLPLVADDEWFFDTELLVVAERNGMRIHEVPVDWVDDPDSRVHVWSTAKGDAAGVWRMMRRLAANDASLPTTPGDGSGQATLPERPLIEQVVRFGSIGLVSTVLFAFGFLVLAEPLGDVGAVIISLVVCSAVNNAANRRLTFALVGRTRRLRHFARGLIVGLLPLTASLISLALLDAAGSSSRSAKIVVLTIVNMLVGVIRFVLLQRWVFRRDRAALTQRPAADESGDATSTMVRQCPGASRKL